jgi:glycosyltransferase involved in cell wall biosynthesis
MNMKPKAHQFLTALSYGDAIGDYTLEIQKILRANGYESEIFTEVVHPKMAKFVKGIHEYALDQDDDTLMIVHFSIGSALGDLIPHLKGKKLMIYHNITPHRWFVDVNTILAYQCLLGRQQLRMLRDYCPVSLADSEYNRQELEQTGYENTGVLPIRLHFDRFDSRSDPITVRQYDDNRTNIIVVGRVIPNKKLEDSLKAFAYYHKYINPVSRLIFVGLWNGFDRYYYGLREMTQLLGLRDVVYTGHVTFEELLAYYRLADVLMILSEHEGFCVPLLEAFHMKVPVLAWGDCAIPYTAGEGGCIAHDQKDFAALGEMMNQLTSNKELREKIVASQLERLNHMADFPFEKTLLKALELLKATKPIYTKDVVKPLSVFSKESAAGSPVKS